MIGKDRFPIIWHIPRKRGCIEEDYDMKASRALGILLILLLLTVTVSGIADETRYEEVFKEYGIYSSCPEVDGHLLFTVYNKAWKYGVIDETGTIRIPIQFDHSPSHVGYGYFSVRNEEEINNQALINADGEILTKYQYAAFNVLDQNWVLGIKVTPTTSELYDYSGSSAKYLIYSVDVYNFSLSSDKVGSLRREQYKWAKVIHGDYLLVQDRNEQVQLYDSGLQPIESAFTGMYQEALYVTTVGFEKCVVSRATGEAVAKGISYVTSIGSTGLYWAKGEASRSGYGLMDSSGNLISALDYDSYFTSGFDGYIKVSYYDRIGLMRLSDGQIVVPCEYDDILYKNSRYVNNGYVAVVKDNKVGFVDLNGNVTCEPRYAKAAVTVLGCTMYAIDLDGTVVVIAADGTVIRDIKALNEYGCSSDGYFLSVQGDGDAWGIIDWHGETVIPFIGEDHFSVKGDGYVIFNDTLYRLLR